MNPPPIGKRMKYELWQVMTTDLQANGLGHSTVWSDRHSLCLDNTLALLAFDSDLVVDSRDIQRNETGILENYEPLDIEPCNSVNSTNTRFSGSIDFGRTFLYLQIRLQLAITICRETKLGSN